MRSAILAYELALASRDVNAIEIVPNALSRSLIPT